MKWVFRTAVGRSSDGRRTAVGRPSDYSAVVGLQYSRQQPSAASPSRAPLFLIDSCMNIQCSRQQPSAASPRRVHLFLIDSSMIFFLQRLRRKMFKNFSCAFGAKCSIFFRRLRRKMFNFFLRASRESKSKFSPRFARKQIHLAKRFGFSEVK